MEGICHPKDFPPALSRPEIAGPQDRMPRRLQEPVPEEEEVVAVVQAAQVLGILGQRGPKGGGLI